MDKRKEEQIKSIALRVYGIVQGVGFRPFTTKLAYKHGITGSVKNKGGLVEITASGNSRNLDAFTHELLTSPPVNSLIVHHETAAIPEIEYKEFTIEPSEDTHGLVFISPDISVCEDCMRELSDKNNERYHHPFISCMSCGPRYSVIEDAPYDRDKTTMRDFEMCPMCEAEYCDRDDRRYHAQTISCHDCGPYLIFSKDRKSTERDKAFQSAVEALNEGGIIAVKGIGGYHLVCSPFDQNTVLRLRELKLREQKPFAVMFSDMNEIKALCKVSDVEEKLLSSPARPIVLLEKNDCTLAPSVCNKSRFVGAFLPYTPLQAMLIEKCGPLIMTSANISEEPIIREDEQMLSWQGLDGVLYNQRRISVSLDDSVVKSAGGKTQVIRRSRGYAPLPVIMKGFEGSGGNVFAAGGQLKASFCLTAGQFAYLSQHIGDLDNESCAEVYRNSYERMKRIFRIEPELAVCDMHPAYASTEFAKSLGLSVIEVQHHHAHIASVLAEYGIEGPVIGVSFDGTGYGTDGAVWGGEFLICKDGEFERAGHLKYIDSLGGDEGMKDAAKSAMFYLYSAGLENYITDERWPVVKAAIENRINVYKNSSMGRLFDAVSAILGICEYNRFEGECAIDVENAAAEALQLLIKPKHMEFGIIESGGMLLADASPVLRRLVKTNDEDKRAVALGFHNAVSDMTADMCAKIRDKSGINDIALSGGVFQNKVLLEDVLQKLKANGFTVYINECVPSNDGGISLGQAYIGMKHLQRKESTCA